MHLNILVFFVMKIIRSITLALSYACWQADNAGEHWKRKRGKNTTQYSILNFKFSLLYKKIVK